jgi:hypothetical protein
MEGPNSFWGYKKQESNLILPEHDDYEDIYIYIYIYIYLDRVRLFWLNIKGPRKIQFNLRTTKQFKQPHTLMILVTKCEDPPWGPPSLLCNRYWFSFTGYSGRNVALNTHPDLLPRFKKSRVSTLLGFRVLLYGEYYTSLFIHWKY